MLTGVTEYTPPWSTQGVVCTVQLNCREDMGKQLESQFQEISTEPTILYLNYYNGLLVICYCVRVKKIILAVGNSAES